MTHRNVLVLGATSAIAEATIRCLAPDLGPGARVSLVARSEPRLSAVAGDLTARGLEVSTIVCDDISADRSQAMLLNRIRSSEPFDLVLIAYGALPDQQRCLDDPETTRRFMDSHVSGYAALLVALRDPMLVAADGSLVVITSVAGDRGRASNYVYGAAKRAVSTMLEGMMLEQRGLCVIDVRPGLVDTPMTASMPKSGPFWSDPEAIARTVVRSIARHRSGVVYAPWFWRYIMLVIRHLPRSLLARLNL